MQTFDEKSQNGLPLKPQDTQDYELRSANAVSQRKNETKKRNWREERENALVFVSLIVSK